MQRLSEGTDIPLMISHRPVSVDLDRLGEPVINRVGFVHDGDTRMPDLVEPIVCNSTTGVSQTRVFPAQNNDNVGGEALLCTVDAADVDKPDLDRDLSWTRVSVRPLDQRGCFRAARQLGRDGKKSSEHQ